MLFSQFLVHIHSIACRQVLQDTVAIVGGLFCGGVGGSGGGEWVQVRSDGEDGLEGLVRFVYVRRGASS